MLSTVQKEIKGGAKRLKKISKNFNKKIKISLKKISSFYKRNKLLSAISLSAFFLLLSGLFLLVSNQTKPNDKIYFLKTNNKAILQNKNPTFNVSFGQREEPGKQWTRFEAKAVKENPFEEEKKGFFEKLLNTIEPKRAFGIEVSLEKIGNKRIETKTELAEIEVPQKKDQEYQLVEKQAVINPDVIEGVDIEYQILEGMGLKENIVIHDLNQYISHCEGDLEGCNLNEFVFDLKLDDGLEVKKGWFTLNMKSGKIYYFTDKNGNYVAHFLPSWANDSLGNKTYDVKLDITEEGGGLKIKVVVNKEWIESEERVYPIRIDPTIVHDTALVFEGGSFVNTKITSKPSIELIESKRPSIDSNTVAYWTLDQQSGSGAYLLDESGNGYHGTPSGTTYISDGVLEGARNFNGSQAITTNLDAAANNLYADTSYAWSVEGWFRHTGATSDGAIVGRGGGTGTSATFGVFVNPNGSLVAVIRGNYTTIKSGVADNKWHHFAVSWDGGVGSYYFDGISGGSLSIGTVALQTGHNVTIGASSNGTNSYYSGDIDEIRISNFSRSKEEIQRTYLNALSRISGNYTSPVVDIGSVSNLEALSWNSEGVHTSDGETPYSSTGLVGQWNFNESSGTTAVSGGSCGTSCNGTLTNFSNTSGRDVVAGSGWSSNNRRWGSGALMFDGSDDYVSISDNNSLDLTDSITLESWVMFNSLSTWQAIISKRDVSLAEANYGLRTSSNQLVFYFYANGAWQDTTTTNANLVAGEWYHISATYDGSSVKIYLNGKLLNSSCISGTCNIPMVADDNNLAIGRAGDNPIQYFSGIIDSTRIYSRTLTPSEILSNYQSGNIEFQYRTSTDGSTWGNWSGGVEESIDNMESATSWQSSNSDVLQIGDTNYSIEGSHSLQIQGGKQKIATGTIGHWSLDETGGTSAYIKDYSGNGNHGTPTGTTYVRDGQIGGSRSFNGSNEYVNLGTGLTPGLPITLSMWVYPRSTNQAQLFSTDKLLFTTHNHTGMWAAINPGGTVSVHYGNNTACASTGRRSKAGTTSLALYQWHHLTLVISGATNMNIYINGVDDGGSYSGTGGNIVYANRDASIGAGGECSTANKIYVFDGIIDDVNLYNYSFTREQAIQLYEAGKHHRVSKTLGTSTDLSSRTKIPFWVASDTLGTNLELTYGNSKYANYEPDSNTVGLWRMEEEITKGVPQNGLVGYWTLDESSGSGAYLQDTSTFTNHGTPTGTSYTTGYSRGARSFGGDGSGHIINTGTHSSLRPVSELTVSAWLYPTNAPASQGRTVASTYRYVSASENHGWNFGSWWTGNYFGFHICAGSSHAMAQDFNFFSSSLNQWVHMVGVYKSSEYIRLYRNGVLVAETTSGVPSSISYNASDPMIIGRRSAQAQSFWHGVIDEVSVHTRSLDSSEIESLYNSTSDRYIKDSSGDNNHGSNWGTTSVSGIIGGARSFNGSSDYIAVPYTPTLNPAVITAESWIKTSSSSTQTIVTQSGCDYDQSPCAFSPYRFRTEGGYLKAILYNDSSTSVTLTSPMVINDGKWHHVAISFGSGTATLYIDGQIVASDSLTGTMSQITNDRFFIGATWNYSAGITNNFSGEIDEVRISNTVRTPEEIRQAYELGRRSHPITVNFKAALQSSNLITGSGDLSFDIDETPYGTTDTIENIDKGEKIIIKENYNGTEYIAQGQIDTVNKSTGAVTVSSWDTGSTFPSGGFTVNATVFKWQREYVDIRYPLDEDIDSVSRLTFRKTTNVPAIFWIDDIKKAKYLDDPTGDTFQRVENKRYLQYKPIFTAWDPKTSSDFYLDSVSVEYNNPPLAPTGLLTEGETNPSGVSTLTPKFSAIFNDDNLTDTAIKYEVQVNSQSDFQGTTLWDSTPTAMTSTNVGQRSPDITYNGTTLSFGGITYYWRIRFTDYYQGVSEWSNIAQFTTNIAPTAPTALLTDGETEAIEIEATPKFSAIFNDPDTGDTSAYYEIHVNTSPGFTGTVMWNSGKTSMTTTNNGERSPDITYNGSLLTMGATTYYWRIKFWDSVNNEGVWSNTTNFTTKTPPDSPSRLLTEGERNPTGIDIRNPKFSAIFNSSTPEDTSSYYKINVNTSPDFTGTVMWDSGKISMTTINNGERCSDITYNGSSLNMILTTYYWRIKFWDGIGNEGEWSNVADFTTFNPPPQAPSSLKTEGKTLAPKVGTLTPKFTAIYSDPNPSDTGEYYEIHVNTSSDFTGTVMWSSGKTSITSIPNGHRSTDITYGGTALTFNGNTYYWRIRFWDTIDNQSDWSETTHFTMSGPPAAPSDLRVEGQTNPSYILSVKPKFSAVFSDSNDDFGAYYQIQITSVSNFSVINLWNSPKTAMSSTPSNASCPPIEYNGTALTGTSGSTYYWRIKFWDTDDFPSSWSSTGTFVDKIENTSLKMGGLKMGGINVDK